MKKKLLFTTLIIFCFTFNSKTFSQSPTTMQDIMEKTHKKIIDLEDQKSQEIVHVTMDLLVGNRKKVSWRYLDPSFDYTLFVTGDRRINKIKVTVYKKNSSNGEWIFVNEYTGGSPELKIQPTEYEQYEFSVTVDEFKSGDSAGHFILMLYHRDPIKSQS